MELSTSIVKAFLQCEDAAYHTHVVGDYRPPVTGGQSRGALVDAVITKALVTTESKPQSVEKLAEAMAGAYGDGYEHVENLLMKSGGYDAAARKAVVAALRLKADPEAQRVFNGAAFQVRVTGTFCGTRFRGDIDIVNRDLKLLLDLKKVASEEPVWAEVYASDGLVIGNRKLAWYDAYDYWMQLTLYKELLGIKDVRTGLLYVTEQDPPAVGLKFLETDALTLSKIWQPVVDRILELERTRPASAKRCGTCPWCRSQSKVTLDTGPVQPYVRWDVYQHGHY